MDHYLLLLMAFILFELSGTQLISDSDNLKKELFNNYDKTLRPVKHFLNKTVVRVEFDLLGVVDVVYLTHATGHSTKKDGVDSVKRETERTEIIKLNYKFGLEWRDHLLTWDPNLFGGLTELLLPQSDLWMPDIVLYERAESLEVVTMLGDGDTGMEFYKNNGEYHIYNLQAKNRNRTRSTGIFSETAYTFVSFFVVARVGILPTLVVVTFLTTTLEMVAQNFKRYPSYYMAGFVGPIIAITQIAFLGIFSPSESNLDRGEKVNIGLTSILAISVVFLVIAEMLPKSKQGLPRLGICIVSNMLLVAVAVFTAVITMFIHYLALLNGWLLPNWALKRLSCKSIGHSNVTQSQQYDFYSRGHHKIGNAEYKLERVITILSQIVSSLNEQNIEQEHACVWAKFTFCIDILCLLLFTLLLIIINIGIWL